MVTNKNGIFIDDGIFSKNKSRKVNVQKKRKHKRYDRYVEMRHKLFKERTVVTPFDKSYIKQLERDGYRLVGDFKIYRLEGTT